MTLGSDWSGEADAWRGSGFSGWTAAVVLLHVLLGLLVYEPVLLANGDNAGYMILAEALRSGEGYRDLHLPGMPIHTKFPPLYPALLAVLGWLGGLQLFKLASLALTSTAVGLTTLLGRRWLGARGAVLAGGLLAVNPLLLEYGHHVMSEALFTALLMASLYAVARSEEGPGGRREADDAPGGSRASRRWWWLGLAAAVAALLTRTVGLALLLGLALYPLFRGSKRRSASAAATVLAATGGWALFQRLAAPGRPGYLKEWLMVHPYDPAAGTVGLAGMAERAAINLWTYVSWLFPSAVTGLAEGHAGGGALVAAVGVGLSVLVLAGWLARCRPRPGPAELTVLLYVAILAVWPSLWVDRRFLAPAIPLLVLYLLVGAGTLGGRAAALFGREGRPDGRENDAVRKRRASPLRGAGLAGTLALTVALAVPAGATLAERAPERVACVQQYRSGVPCQVPAFESFFEAARWAGANTAPEAVFVSAKPRLFYLHSGRRSRIYRYTDDPDRMLRDLLRSRVDYVVVDDLPGIGDTTRRYLVPAVRAHGERFEAVYEGGDPPIRILRVGRGSEPSGGIRSDP